MASPSTPQPLLWKLLFIHLSFCFCHVAKFSHTFPLSLPPSKLRSPSPSSMSLDSKSFLPLTILLALLHPFSNSIIAFLRCGDQNHTQHLQSTPTSYMQKNNALCLALSPLSQDAWSWHFFWLLLQNWGIKETASGSKITFLNCNCQLLIQHHVILVWIILC